MYYTGIDPFTKQQVYVARHLRDRKLQRALMQFFKPENYFEVRKALARKTYRLLKEEPPVVSKLQLNPHLSQRGGSRSWRQTAHCNLPSGN
jgi:hypothetical protein